MKNKKLFAILTLVCFMMTLMPVAAFAATTGLGTSLPVADSLSVVWTEDTRVDAFAAPNYETASFNLKLNATDGVTTTAAVFVWVTTEGSNIPVNTVRVNNVAAGSYVYKIDPVGSGANQFTVGFLAPGKYQVHVSTAEPTITNGSIAAASEFKAAGSVVTVTGTNDKTEDYVIKTSVGAVGTIWKPGAIAAHPTQAYLADGDTQKTLKITANNVDEKEVTITLYKDAADFASNKAKAGVKVDIEVVGAITTDKTTVYTNALGEAKFKIGGSRDGIYKVYLSTGKYESMIEVKVGAIVANSIESDCETGKWDILGASNLAQVIGFTMYDVNGNKLDVKDMDTLAEAAAQGWGKAFDSTNDDYTGDGTVDATGYVAIVEKPADSKITNADLTFDGTTIVLNNSAVIDAEGIYTFKVVLDNGAYTTATVDVKAFDKPVMVVINGPDNVELGSETTYYSIWVDAYGVKDVTTKGVDIVPTGYAVEDINSALNPITGIMEYDLKAKSDEKYEGSVITLTAVDERYNLVATKEVSVAAQAQKLSFAADTAEVNVNNYIKISVVDANGKVVALDTTIGTPAVSYVVLEKPEGANVFVTTHRAYSTKDKNFIMNLTSNKVGNVKVQAIVKYEETTGMNEVANVVKYYTGTQTIAVGTGEIGKSVVMSIGSNELIVGSEVTKMDAKPMVQNSRTFVPFRALAEAFGATVAYDQATSSVTAELNGVKVVMTVGAPVYTVNGVEKTADVAPFISDSRTFVPVRFAAEAFGIEVVPTYNTDGSVADVLFNM